MVATLMEHLAISTYGQWIYKSPSGELPNWEPGIESIIPLTPEENIDRLQIGPINQDAYRILDIIQKEKENGMLSSILNASNTNVNSGVLFQQFANAALNALEPYHDGMEEFGQRVGGSVLAQLQRAASAIKPFEVTAPAAKAASRQTYFVVEFDPKRDLDPKRKLRPRPVFKPALPDDLAVRINAARLALDPRRPILSLTSVLENILQVEDPTEEIDRIWEDIAYTDPVLVLEQISEALIRLGEDELAQRIRENQFKTAFIQELQFRQQTGNVPQAPGAPVPAPPGSPPGMPSEAGGFAPTNETQGIPASPGAPPGMEGAMGAGGPAGIS